MILNRGYLQEIATMHPGMLKPWSNRSQPSHMAATSNPTICVQDAPHLGRLLWHDREHLSVAAQSFAKAAMVLERSIKLSGHDIGRRTSSKINETEMLAKSSGLFWMAIAALYWTFLAETFPKEVWGFT